MVECKINADKMAAMIGVNRATFYRKLENSGEAFTIREVNIIAKALNLDLDELNAIFLALMSHKCDKTHQSPAGCARLRGCPAGATRR